MEYHLPIRSKKHFVPLLPLSGCSFFAFVCSKVTLTRSSPMYRKVKRWDAQRHSYVCMYIWCALYPYVTDDLMPSLIPWKRLDHHINTKSDNILQYILWYSLHVLVCLETNKKNTSPAVRHTYGNLPRRQVTIIHACHPTQPTMASSSPLDPTMLCTHGYKCRWLDLF